MLPAWLALLCSPFPHISDESREKARNSTVDDDAGIRHASHARTLKMEFLRER
jgi:hypothetical protein